MKIEFTAYFVDMTNMIVNGWKQTDTEQAEIAVLHFFTFYIVL